MILHRLLIYLTSAEGLEPVAALMPSPQALIEADRNPWFHLWCSVSLVSLGARAYLRMKNKDEEAAETARGGLAEAKK